ncbi:MAG TPA: carboxylesterase [Methylophilaceae bacterium]|jgi:phospholipase/carboxylesterase|nr:carboxylesterase [Methylophilaceae bacterium]HAP04843.1 carboxylesterase [Methylophilaceae bacterium]HCB68701.1 carboxylesterase [Methylophilaceae bacterium]HCC72289.1 carboxylesterase [Methylophilaceae bacterium]
MTPIIIDSVESPIGVVIFLHGLGADGFDFKDIFTKPQFNKIRFILPHAPYQPVTINQGYEMRAWYDLYDLSFENDEDELGMERSSLSINKLIEDQISFGIPSEKIIIGGFSQGAAMSFYLGLKYPKKLGGIAALSGYLPLKDKLTDSLKGELANMPIFMAHGLYDNVIEIGIADSSFEKLSKEFNSASFLKYPMGHEVCEKEIDDLSIFFNQLLN